MQDKHVAITGPTAGIGRATSLELARQGAQLTLFCRNADKANALCDEIATVADHVPRVILMDMADLGSVRRAAQTFLETAPPLDVLLNNAGVINTTRRETVDGFEETLAVNHFAPFLLTGLLMPAIQHGGNVRIVNVASAAHEFVRGMDFDDMHAQKSYSTFRVYGRSKLANILFTRSLAQRLEDTPITVNCLHPGAVSTSLGTACYRCCSNRFSVHRNRAQQLPCTSVPATRLPTSVASISPTASSSAPSPGRATMQRRNGSGNLPRRAWTSGFP